jgi:two-component system, NtrC family, sensor histidine kinase HydH
MIRLRASVERPYPQRSSRLDRWIAGASVANVNPMKTRSDPRDSISGRRARWGWLLTTLALGVVVIGTAWASYQSARQAVDDLVRAEAHVLRDAVMAANRSRSEQRADFDSLIAAQEHAGLRYLAWMSQDGSVVAEGGRPAPEMFDLPDSSRDPVFVRLGTRFRVYFPPPAPPDPFGGRFRQPERHPPPTDERRPPSGEARPQMRPGQGGTPHTLVMEFEPVVATELMARANRSLVVAVIVAGVLMSVGLVFWQMSQRVEAGERRVAEERRLAVLGEMSAVLAHEIRNPLASLKGHAQLLVERLSSHSPERRKADRVVDEATRLEALTTDLLDFARTGPMDVQPVDPAELLRLAAADVSEDGIQVECANAPSTWPLDHRRFRQSVLVNLLRNAIQASPPNQPPQADVFMEHGNLVFTIRDFGPGLPRGQEERIFDPFFTTRTSGTGLGLPLAKRIVELHGGRIAAANAHGGGAIFRIDLPGAR